MARNSFGQWGGRNGLGRSLIALTLVALVLAACGTQVSSTNYPGLSADGERVYLAYGPGVLAYDVVEQRIAWTYPAEPNPAQLYYAAPSVDEGRVIVGDYGVPGGFFSPGVTVSLFGLEEGDSSTPLGRWTVDDVATDKIVAPPLQAEGKVFVGTADNFLHALEAESGQLLWSFETGHSIWGQPAYRDGVVFVTSLDNAVYAIDANDGSLQWRTAVTGALPAQAVLDSDLLYVGSFDGDVHALEVASGSERWSAMAEDWIWGAPGVSDGRVFYADAQGNIFAADADTGEIAWQAQTSGAAQTPVVSGDVVYVTSTGEAAGEQSEPTGVVIALSAADGDELWRQRVSAPLFSPPVVVADFVVVAPQSQSEALVAFDRASGVQRWQVALPAA